MPARSGAHPNRAAAGSVCRRPTEAVRRGGGMVLPVRETGGPLGRGADSAAGDGAGRAAVGAAGAAGGAGIRAGAAVGLAKTAGAATAGAEDAAGATGGARGRGSTAGAGAGAAGRGRTQRYGTRRHLGGPGRHGRRHGKGGAGRGGRSTCSEAGRLVTKRVFRPTSGSAAGSPPSVEGSATEERGRGLLRRRLGRSRRLLGLHLSPQAVAVGLAADPVGLGVLDARGVALDANPSPTHRSSASLLVRPSSLASS